MLSLRRCKGKRVRFVARMRDRGGTVTFESVRSFMQQEIDVGTYVGNDPKSTHS